MTDLQQQLAFIIEIDKLKAVYRQTTVKEDNDRQENSAEHSWHITLVAQLLQDYAEQPIDITRVVKMLLIHDIIEIDAGDLFAFAETKDHQQQALKEEQAAQRLFGLLPEAQHQEYKSLWFEFEQAETNDAQFAKGMDRILPLVQNMNNQGGSWAKHKISRSQVLARNSYLEKSAPKLWQYVVEQTELAVANGWLK
ncbi:HD family hydrolase [Psychromonas sp. 14N.309.X.WAT.B.A12]|uniref:HD domain-containing protein n=1 Tax=unclassified Psychromonas TaxID=2614957 RepID=UPI0025AF11DF|nr:HD domain-containing protein [Psychromonas sp. 14N.309.X.WAT.B.A12]MDN2663867.1 HD domain-containing protein [Psychromonas sp. 14N.309.X.WAT.B.A12]